MTNKKAERRNFLHKQLGNVFIEKEDCRRSFTDFTVITSRGDRRMYRVYGNRMDEDMRMELFL